MPTSLSPTDLQRALSQVGVYEGAIDGAIGPQTELAIKRFQWNLKRVPYRNRINGNRLEPRAIDGAIQVSGILDDNIEEALRSWTQAGAVTTGNLIRVDVSQYPHLVNQAEPIDHPDMHTGQLVVDAQFVGKLAVLDAQAAAASVKLQINQTLRVAGAGVHGAVVTPAQRSQHLIGHAVDGNLVVGAHVVLSSEFKDHSAPPAALDYIQRVKANGLRWGGDFGTVDYIHFDDFVDPNGDEWTMRYFFNQRMIADRQPLPAVASLVA